MEAFNNEMIKLKRINRNENHTKTMSISKRCKRFIVMFFRCFGMCKKNIKKHEKTRKNTNVCKTCKYWFKTNILMFKKT